MRLRSLKNKLALVFCGITLLAMTGVWFYVVPQLESSLRAQRRDDLKRVALATVDSLQRVEAGSNVRRSQDRDYLLRALAQTADARGTPVMGLDTHDAPPPFSILSCS